MNRVKLKEKRSPPLDYFLSGQFPIGKLPIYKDIVKTARCRLFSMHANYEKLGIQSTDWIMENGHPGETKVILDSGAFTSWTKGQHVSINALIKSYARYIDKYESRYESVHLINLDVIPGTLQKQATAQEMQDGMKQSLVNYDILHKEFGDRVLPVFHQGEPWSYLKEVAAVNDYICLSPQNNVHEANRVLWSEEVHTRCDNKTHGLATTGKAMITKNRWQSVDSASWVRHAAVGKVMLCTGKGSYTIVPVSEKSPCRMEAMNHYDNYPKVLQEELAAEFAKYNLSVESLRTDVGARMAFNIVQIYKWVDSLPAVVGERPTSIF